MILSVRNQSRASSLQSRVPFHGSNDAIQNVNSFFECIFKVSCIQFLKSLVDINRQENPSTNTAQVWDYLWHFIKEADAFVWHPIKGSIPKQIPLSKLFLMPAVLDPLDGLNKPLSATAKDYYQRSFNRIAFDAVSKRLDFKTRPIIAQFCRFDPSKGMVLRDLKSQALKT